MKKETIITMKYSTIYHISSKNHLHVDCFQDVFVMYKNKLIFQKRDVITPIHDSMIPVDCCKKIYT